MDSENSFERVDSNMWEIGLVIVNMDTVLLIGLTALIMVIQSLLFSSLLYLSRLFSLLTCGSLFQNSSIFGFEYQEGEWENDQRNGYGICYYADGERYTGYWKDHWRNGEGTSVYPNGNRYVGTWYLSLIRIITRFSSFYFYLFSFSFHQKVLSDVYIVSRYKDMKQGKGTLYISLDKILYEGEWWRNKRYGRGTFLFQKINTHNHKIKFSVTLYIENDDKLLFCITLTLSLLKKCEGTQYYISGDKYEGEWILDKKDGQGHYIGHNGTEYKGSISLSYKHNNDKLNK